MEIIFGKGDGLVSIFYIKYEKDGIKWYSNYVKRKKNIEEGKGRRKEGGRKEGIKERLMKDIY